MSLSFCEVGSTPRASVARKRKVVLKAAALALLPTLRDARPLSLFSNRRSSKSNFLDLVKFSQSLIFALFVDDFYVKNWKFLTQLLVMVGNW